MDVTACKKCYYDLFKIDLGLFKEYIILLIFIS